MAKKVKTIIKLQIQAGKANPAPPVGPALGQHGVNIMAFCKEYNERTANFGGSIVPVEITVYEDRSFIFVTKTPPTTDLLKKALGIEKGAHTTGREKVGELSREKLREIAQIKLKDLNANDINAAEKIAHDPVSRVIAHNSYSDGLPEPSQVTCYSLEEIFAEKLRAMGERGFPRDLYDIVFLFRGRHFQNNQQRLLLSFCRWFHRQDNQQKLFCQ